MRQSKILRKLYAHFNGYRKSLTLPFAQRKERLFSELLSWKIRKQRLNFIHCFQGFPDTVLIIGVCDYISDLLDRLTGVPHRNSGSGFT
jgi:hypothetical protein